VAKRSSGTQKSKPKARAVGNAEFAALQMIFFDFDGVMSDNRVLVMQYGTEGVMCNRSDGLGIGMLHAAGVPMMVISKEENPVVSARCRKLKLPCLQGVDDKLPALKRILEERGFTAKKVAYVGNDLNDLECMSHVGLPIAVADAYDPVLRVARWTTSRPGGHGAVREVCDRVLAARKSR
jgi:YrbI family 3-deoxy-D-manno-octulosonate 8-phosphate phosphatase